MKQIRKRLTYANVMSSIAVFLVLGGATAFAAVHLGKNSVGTKQLKKNAVTAAKIKKDAVTAPRSATRSSRQRRAPMAPTGKIVKRCQRRRGSRATTATHDSGTIARRAHRLANEAYAGKDDRNVEHRAVDSRRVDCTAECGRHDPVTSIRRCPKSTHDATPAAVVVTDASDASEQLDQRAATTEALRTRRRSAEPTDRSTAADGVSASTVHAASAMTPKCWTLGSRPT